MGRWIPWTLPLIPVSLYNGSYKARRRVRSYGLIGTASQQVHCKGV